MTPPPTPGDDERPSRRTEMRVGGVTCRCDPGLDEVLRAIYAGGEWVFDHLRRQPGAQVLRGRRELVAGELGGEKALIKRLHHGGTLAALTGDRFLSSRRLENQLKCADFLAAKGIVTPATLLVAWRRRCGLVRGEIGVRFIPDALDGGQLLFRPGLRLPDDWERRVAELAALVARLHRLGVRHGDLNLRNFLFLPAGGVAILDLDKAVRARRLGPWQRRRNLARLVRSIRKLARLATSGDAERVVAALHRAYRGSDATD
ncbi:MAG: lipopolysaccharide kinase InaA family protein [Acidobacteriota bacterium]